MRSNIRIGCILAAAVSPLYASASLPWIIDWAHTAPFQHFLLRLCYISNENGPTRLTSQPRAQIAYGVTSNLELNIRTDLYLKDSSGGQIQNLGDVVYGAKYRFYKDKRDTELGIGYTLTQPSSVPALTAGGWASNPYFMASKTIGKFGVYTQFGAVHSETKATLNSLNAGVLVTYNLTSKLMLGSEFYTGGPTKVNSHDEALWSLGAAYRQNPSVMYYARVGHSMEGFSDELVTVGVQINF